MLNPLSQLNLSISPLWHRPLASSFKALEAANQTEPGLDFWGYLAHHSGRGCGGPPVSFGVFLWFSSFERMLQALVQGEARAEFDNDNLAPEAQKNILKMQVIADNLAKNPQEISRACRDFSEVFNFLDVEWIGQFKELEAGDTAYARETRRLFRQSKSEKDELPIRAEEKHDFIEMLSIWSI